MKYDKFYTKKEVAERCYAFLMSSLRKGRYLFLEPSAGSGNLLEVLKENGEAFYACDILPEGCDIHTKDFLKDTLELKGDVVVFGNPPFGKKGRTAIDFINKAFDYSRVVAFILPIQFRKYSVQRRIREDARLIVDEDLPENAFTDRGRDYSLRSCFQIWITDDSLIEGSPSDLRRKKPSAQHPDFVMYQYNHTKEALKYFSYDWDFAVPRQGFEDYSSKIYDKNALNERKQYIFFKASTQRVLDNLLKLDFNKLSRKNTIVPGFGMADVVEEYNELFPSGLDNFF